MSRIRHVATRLRRTAGDRGIRASSPVVSLIVWAAAATAAMAPAGANAASWQQIAPRGGAVSGLAVDPTDPATVYAANGIDLWKSVDAGASWFLSDSGLFDAPAKVVIDPTAPATLYAVGTEIAKSVDGGVSWTVPQPPVPPGPSVVGTSDWPFNVTGLAIDPRSPGTLFAAASAGRVFKSTDGGASWSATGPGLRPRSQILSVAIDPFQSSVIYAGTSVGVFKSADGGASWQPARSGMGRAEISALAADPVVPGRVYAAAVAVVHGKVQATAPHLFVSQDSGSTWTGHRLAADNPLVDCLLASSAAAGTVYACGRAEGLFRSADGGVHWTPIDTGLETSDLGALALAPSLPSRLYAGTGDNANLGPAIFRTSSSGAAWSAASNGFGNLLLSSFVLDPVTPGTLYLEAENAAGVLKTDDDGATWTPAVRGLQRAAPAFGESLVIDPVAPATLYLETERGFFTSHDGAARWFQLSVSFRGRPPLAVVPGAPNVLYSTSFVSPTSADSLWKSLDGGVTWTSLDTAGLEFPTAIVVAPSALATLYVVGAVPGLPVGEIKSVLRVSHDAGMTFQTLAESDQISAIAIDPADASALYVASFGVFKSVNGGASFVQVLPGLDTGTIAALAVDPAHPSVVYAQTPASVLMSRDGGSTWSQLGPSLPAASGEGQRRIEVGPSGAVYVLVGSSLFRSAP